VTAVTPRRNSMHYRECWWGRRGPGGGGHHDDPYAKDALSDGSLVQADHAAAEGAVPLVRPGQLWWRV